VVDVRTDAEWDAGHIDGALHLELDDLAEHLARVPAERELVVVCKAGYARRIGSSLIERAGFTRVTDLRAAWTRGRKGASASRRRARALARPAGGELREKRARPRKPLPLRGNR
jgi:rhodanese-related sulfurtransferase